MTLELLNFDRNGPMPGYAGSLEAARNADLADRFHFWRGASGHRYACTRFARTSLPNYEDAVALFVRRRGGETTVVGIGLLSARPAIPFDTDEVHVHLVQGGPVALESALKDLSALVVRRAPLYTIDRRAA
jgi:hypothetical protein